ncbi:VirD4-like conjugal transfer protein, CD1115 family [Bacillus sp. FSL K6-6540]|uniref:VirD4-like conjugal transfer protein, CD1115 family n=1 Tax=Bacillus sp. FSL K6-6540 TaxID=2921512 RepID=UPI0030F5A70F
MRRNIVKWCLVIAGIFLVHLYVAGGLIALFMIINQADWTDGQLLDAFKYWTAHYFNPLDLYSNVLIPTNQFDVILCGRVFMSLPISILIFLFTFRSLWMRKKYQDASTYGSHGTARWATLKEILRKGDVTGSPHNEINSAGVVLGYVSAKDKRYVTIPPDSELNQNVIVFGGSGVGKDYTYITTQIFHTMVPFEPEGKRKQKALDRRIPKEYSLVVVDPKGESYNTTAASLEEKGYEVYSFNLVNMKASHRWNALDYVKDDISAEKLANLIVTSEGHTNGDPFWPRAEKALMVAIMLFVKFELPENMQHLPNVLHIGLTFNEEERLDMLFNALPYNHPAVMKYKIFKMAQSETRAGILIGFGTQLTLFANRQIAELTSQSDFKLDNIGKRKTALFLIIPDGDTTFSALTSLFFTQLLQQLWDVANENGGTCPVGVRILGNEWANIGRVPMLAERTSVMRSKGVSVQLVLQAKSQLEKTYEKDAPIIMQNCDTIVFLGTNDSQTAQEMEKDLGETTIEVQTRSQSETNSLLVGDKVNISTQHQARKLRTADEIRKNSRIKNIIVQNASYPFEVYKTPFTEHPLAKNYRDKKRNCNEVIPPKHRGMEYFTEEDFYKLIGGEASSSPKITENDLPDVELSDDTISILEQIESMSMEQESNETIQETAVTIEADEIDRPEVDPETGEILGEMFSVIETEVTGDDETEQQEPAEEKTKKIKNVLDEI